jgi:hypothetical protein
VPFQKSDRKKKEKRKKKRKVQIKGRERINHLNPEQFKIAADWLSYFDRFWDERFSRLRKVTC